MRFFLSSAVPRTGCSLRCRRANPLSVVAAALVAASLSCADSQRLAHGPSRWCSTWLRAGGHLSETLAIQSASSAVTASLTAQRRGVSSTTSASADAAATTASAVAAVAALSTGTKLRNRRGAHRKRGRVSATAGVTLPPDVQLGDGKSGTCAVAIDPVVSATVLVNPSEVSSEPLSQRAVKSSGLAARGACTRTLGDVAAEVESPAVTTAAYLNGLGTSAEKPMACPPSAGEADAAEPALAASVAATDAAEMTAPRRKGRGRKPQRGANGGRTAVEAATEATVESLAVAAPAPASSPAVAAPLAEVSAEAIAMAATVSHVKPSRGLTKRRLRRREPGATPAASAGDVEANGVKTAGVAVVPSATIGPNHAPSVIADVGEGKGGTPVAESVSAVAPPLSPQHVDATCRAVTPDADAVEGGLSSRSSSSSSSSRRRIGRQRRQKSVGESVSAKGTEVLQGNDEVSRAADVDGDRNHTSEDGSARQSGRRQRSSSRTRGGKRLRATSPTADIGAVGKGASAAAVVKSAAEGVRDAAEQAPVTGGATAGGATLASFSLLTTATPPQPASMTTTTSLTTVDTKAPAAFTAELGSSGSKTGADVELSAEAVGTTAASCASRGNRRPRGNRMKGRHLVSAAVTDDSGDTATAAAGPAATAAVEDGETATTPSSAATVSSASVDSFKKLFATVDVAAAEAAKGLSSLAAKKRLAAQIIRRRWQLQRGLKLSPQTLPSTTTSTADEASTTATSAAAKDDEVAAAEAAVPTSSAPSSSPSPRRRLKRGKKSALIEAAVLSLTAAELLPEKPAGGGEAPVAGGVKPKSRTTKRGGKLGGSAAKRHGAGTTAIAAAAPGAPVAEQAKAAEVEDAARDAEAEADVAAAMATAVELVSKPEVVNDEFSLALQTDDGAVADTTSIPHSLAAPVPSCASQKPKFYGAGDLKVTSGAKGSSSTGGSGNCAGGSSSSSGSSGKAGKGANSKDTLFFPDYRERVVQLFEQLAQINSALGERFKSQSYGRTVEHLKRGDKVFQLLPPNLLPLPEDDPEKKAAVEALYKDDSAAQKRRAEEVERNRAKRSLVLSPDNLIPGLGTKLREKVIEILVTGGLEELHRQEAKPIIRAIRELTQVHGVGPRTAIDYFKKYDISTVAQLRDYAIKAGELDMNNKDSGKPSNLVARADKSKFHLNDAQRLGLVYYEDMCHRIPHDEGRLHEAFMKLRMRRYLGTDYELVVCGSYRRQVESAGDIDVLITHKRSAAEGGGGSSGSGSGSRPLLPPSEVLGAFLAGLKADKYIEATLAQGPTKFMGLCRLRAVENASAAAATGKGKAAKAKSTARPKFRARRLDVRYVDSAGFPAAMLYFTGSKNFNVIMRSEAIKKRCILNEYGLFRKPTRRQMQQYGVLQRNPNMTFHDMVTRLARFDLSAIKGGEDELTSEPSAVPADASSAAGSGAGSNADGASAKVTAAAKKVKGKGKEKTKQELAELREMARIVERQRVKASTEREIFEALGMDYVSPKDRSV